MSEAAVSSLERDKIVQAVIGMNDSPAEQSDGASRRSVVLVTGMSGSGKSTGAGRTETPRAPRH
jgi:adenylylsulfate kinase-like enzyme